MEQQRMHVVDLIRQAEQRHYEGKPLERMERPEYRKARYQHAQVHIASETAALSLEASRARQSNHLTDSRRERIVKAIEGGEMSNRDIAKAYAVTAATVAAIKKQMVAGTLVADATNDATTDTETDVTTAE